MSKLDVIILKYGNAVLDLPKTNDPLGKPVDEAKEAIKAFFKDMVAELEEDISIYDSLSPKDYVSGKELARKIEEL
jgi:hypothetical protein